MPSKKQVVTISQKEAAEQLGIEQATLIKMRKKGKLEAEMVGRSVRISQKVVEELRPIVNAQLVLKGEAYAVLGTISCGPSCSSESFDEPETIRIKTIHPPETTRVLRANGRSCSGWGIFDGSLVFVRTQPEPEDGRFIVLQTSDGYTLKAYHGGKFYSFEKGSNSPQVYNLEDATVWGVVVHVMSEPHFEMKNSLDRRSAGNNS